MAGTGSGYDLSVTTFSPDGRVFQVEYAGKAVENSGTSLAICCKDGVIFGVENFLISKMLVNGSNRRTMPVHRRAGMAVAGLLPDARQIVNRARQEAKSYLNAYCEEMPPNVLADRLGLFMHAYTLYWSVRPFGCSVLFGCVDKETKEPSLYSVEPSGVAYKYQGTAVGKGRQAAKTEIEKLLATPGGVTCEQALVQVARILHKIHDEKDRDFALEVSWICPASNYEFAAVPKDKLDAAEAQAKAMLEAEDE
eukprot:TRINITY_DN56524_c0_g1_i1.p2 TRINITY_DN56524_c0_g1~~TRINITY_DN56524_c0_g1_i1.p2  ORF type:complete len:284 (+),score=73.26 TRINITY_DN56524_c0_g1_i1:99-854(+)